ncbi:unnamed protein product [Ilex paraguariensis]|uniref:DUF679 domain-containing protein n=1 Tax=Ilex paraguariensis TaxID=185542 RepID=A0ABC8RJX1_9AQUA
MDARVNDASNEAALEEQQQPLLEDPPADRKPAKTPAQKGIRKTFKGTALLANHLPTGSVLAFQILSPVLTHEGRCLSIVSQSLTLCLIGLIGFSCFLVCFTDSFRDGRGKVRYGVATVRGLWVIDGSVTLPPEEAAKYKLRVIDFVHAFMSILVFGAVALFDVNVIKCLFPEQSEFAKELLTTLPVAIGVICSLLFVAFPTTRHGIGFPLSRK